MGIDVYSVLYLAVPVTRAQLYLPGNTDARVCPSGHAPASVGDFCPHCGGRLQRKPMWTPTPELSEYLREHNFEEELFWRGWQEVGGTRFRHLPLPLFTEGHYTSDSKTPEPDAFGLEILKTNSHRNAPENKAGHVVVDLKQVAELSGIVSLAAHRLKLTIQQPLLYLQTEFNS